MEGENPPQLCSLLARGSEKVRGQLSVVSGWSQNAACGVARNHHINWCALYRAAVGGKRCLTPSAPPSFLCSLHFLCPTLILTLIHPIIIVHCLISSADARDFSSHKLVRIELPASSKEDGFSLQGIYVLMHR